MSITKKMNFLFIMTDQFQADCLGYMGNKQIFTPNLDKLAKQSTVFTNTFCQSPVCMASRGSLATGRYPNAIRIRGMGILPQSECTTQEQLQRNGYNTGAFGKLHFTPEVYTSQILKKDIPELNLNYYTKDAILGNLTDDPFKINYGFQDYVGCEDILQGNFIKWIKEKNLDKHDLEKGEISNAPADLYVSPYTSEFHQITYITNQAIKYIKSQNSSKPWFTFCSFIAPHHPFEAPLDQIEKYKDFGIQKAKWKGGVQKEFLPAPVLPAINEFLDYSDEAKQKIILHYYASISLIDDNIGRLIKTLEEENQLENTVIIFTSDHGEFLGNHGMLRKPSIHYDDVIRVPLLIAVPQCTAGKINTGLVELVDIHPTILGLAGVDINRGVQGVNWSEDIKSGKSISKDSIFSTMSADPTKVNTCKIPLGGPYIGCHTLRTKHWKLNIYPETSSKFGQLFNLLEDPDEAINLYHEHKYANQKEEMLWKLYAKLNSTRDPLPLILSQF